LAVAAGSRGNRGGAFTVQLDVVLRGGQSRPAVHASVFVQRQHDGPEAARGQLRFGIPQTAALRRRRSQPRRVLLQARRARPVPAPLLRRLGQELNYSRDHVCPLHRKHRAVLRRGYVIRLMDEIAEWNPRVGEETASYST